MRGYCAIYSVLPRLLKGENMNKEQKLIAQIGRCSIDIGKMAKEQARLQAELEGLKEPELKHGDYGFTANKYHQIMLRYESGIELFGGTAYAAKKDNFEKFRIIRKCN